jgi:hypothetical protein
MHTPKNCVPSSACAIAMCDPHNGLCFETAIDCDDFDKCTIDECIHTTGKCVHSQIPCNDNIMCTLDMCDRTTGECQYIPEMCNDGNVCSVDYCLEHIGCVHIKPFPIERDDQIQICDGITGEVMWIDVCGNQSGMAKPHYITFLVVALFYCIWFSIEKRFLL